jgi:hypothetical protein
MAQRPAVFPGRPRLKLSAAASLGGTVRERALPAETADRVFGGNKLPVRSRVPHRPGPSRRCVFASLGQDLRAGATDPKVGHAQFMESR